MPEVVVVLHNIRSLHNTGSIFRTSDAAGVRKIYLCGITPAPADRLGKIRPQFAKVSLGAERNIPWEKIRGIRSCLTKLKKDKYKIFAVEQDRKSIPYFRAALRISPASKIALVLGNEVRGLTPSVLKFADEILEIPMRGKLLRHRGHPRHGRGSPKAACRFGRGKESLNVAVAFGIAVFGLLYKGNE